VRERRIEDVQILKNLGPSKVRQTRTGADFVEEVCG
jgi:hypothetical protein